MTTHEEMDNEAPKGETPIEAGSPEYWEIYVPDGVISQEEEETATEIGVRKFFENIDTETMRTLEGFMQSAKENSAQSYLDSGDLVGLSGALRRTMNYLKIVHVGNSGLAEGFIVGKFIDAIQVELHKARRAMLNAKKLDGGA
jgi:hypothetical protein